MNINTKAVSALAAIRALLAQDDQEETCIAVEDMTSDIVTRSGWAGAGEDYTPAEFRLTLTRDGVTVVGMLGHHYRPVAATIEGYYGMTPEDAAMLVQFCDYLQFGI